MHRLSFVLPLAGLLLLLTLLVLLPGLASAQSGGGGRSVTWRDFDVQIAVQPDGSFEVTERQQVAFQGGSFHQADRAIPLDRVEAIDNVRVSEVVGGQELPYASGSNQPHTFSTSTSGDQRTVTWWFDPTSDATGTFVLRYTVHGGLRIYDQGDQLWWKAIYADRDGPIQAGSVEVQLPANVAADSLKTAWYRELASAASDEDLPQAGSGQVVDARTVRFDTGPLNPNQGAEVRVQFPHGIVQAQAPAWQADADRQTWLRTAVAPIGNFLAVLLAAGIVSVSVAAVALSRFHANSDADVGAVPHELEQPPSDLPAPLVGTLVDGHPSPRDTVAVLVDLAQRGLVRLDATQKDHVLLTPLVASDDPRLRDYERQLLRALAGPRASQPAQQALDLTDARRRFAASVPVVRRALAEALVDAHLFADNPLSRRQRITWLTTAMLVVGFGLVVWRPLASVAPASNLTGFALIVGGVLLRVVLRIGARRTLAGVLEARRWQAFERFLRRASTAADGAAGWRDVYLPYAVAFGLDRTWLRRLEAEHRPAPVWYASPWPSSPLYATLPTSGAAPGETTAASGAGHTGFAMLSPQAWSDSLANLLDSASTALAGGSAWTSSNWTSGSSSGGSGFGGSGGFSGGGDAGGGGGGGGSGGFS